MKEEYYTIEKQTIEMNPIETNGFILDIGGSGYREDPGYSFYRYRTSADLWEALSNLLCSVGEWVGNRLGYAGGTIYCWQGNKSKSDCGGSALLRWEP